MLTTCARVPEQVRKRFPQEDVDLKIFGPGKKGLTRGVRITFANSPLIEKSSEERGQQAKETPNIVKSHCPEIKDIEEIDVIFAKVSDVPGIFHFDIPVEIFRFDNDANPLPSEKSPSEVLPETGSNTAPRENEQRIIALSFSPGFSPVRGEAALMNRFNGLLFEVIKVMVPAKTVKAVSLFKSTALPGCSPVRMRPGY